MRNSTGIHHGDQFLGFVFRETRDHGFESVLGVTQRRFDAVAAELWVGLEFVDPLLSQSRPHVALVLCDLAGDALDFLDVEINQLLPQRGHCRVIGFAGHFRLAEQFVEFLDALFVELDGFGEFQRFVDRRSLRRFGLGFLGVRLRLFDLYLRLGLRFGLGFGRRFLAAFRSGFFGLWFGLRLSLFGLGLDLGFGFRFGLFRAFMLGGIGGGEWRWFGLYDLSRCRSGFRGGAATGVSTLVSGSAITLVLLFVLLEQFGVAQLALDFLLSQHFHVERWVPPQAVIEPVADVAFAETQERPVGIGAAFLIGRNVRLGVMTNLEDNAIEKVAALRMVHPDANCLVVFCVPAGCLASLRIDSGFIAGIIEAIIDRSMQIERPWQIGRRIVARYQAGLAALGSGQNAVGNLRTDHAGGRKLGSDRQRRKG